VAVDDARGDVDQLAVRGRAGHEEDGAGKRDAATLWAVRHHVVFSG
jgi:hypothetical protein